MKKLQSKAKVRKCPPGRIFLSFAFASTIGILIFPAASVAKEARSLSSFDPRRTMEFLGLDLTDAFPDWKNKQLNLDAVYEGNKGGLIARLGVANPDGSEAKAWDVDLIHKTKLAAPADIHLIAKFEGDSDEKFQEIKNVASRQVSETLGVGVKPGETRIINGEIDLSNEKDSCEDPIRNSYRLQQFEPENRRNLTGWSTIKSITIITKESLPGGYEIGGDCGDFGYVKPKKFASFASTDGGSLLFHLSDGSALVQTSEGIGQHAIILRLESDLNIKFSSKYFLTLDLSDYIKLANTKGIVAAQEELLSKLK